MPTDKGANAGLKVASLVAGMVAGADSIDDMALLRHGGMGRIFARAYAPSTSGSFLRAFTYGHVRQLDAVASRFLVALAGLTRLLGAPTSQATATDHGTSPGYAVLDVDDTIVEVHGHAKQGRRVRLLRVRGLNALLATLTTAKTAPVIVAQWLRKGACGSPRGAKRLVGDAVKQARQLLGHATPILVRMDSALCRHRHNEDLVSEALLSNFGEETIMSDYWRGLFSGPLAAYVEGLRAEFSTLGYAPSTVTPIWGCGHR